MSDLVRDLVRIGAIQFGQFEMKDRPGEFAPVAIRLGLLPSYPSVLRALAQELAPLVKIDGLTHLLAAPSAVPLGVAVSLAADMPLVYPTSGDSDGIEGAYDYSVPTVLLTNVLSDGSAERALIKRVKSVGLEVRAVVAVIALGPVNLTTNSSPLRREGSQSNGVPPLDEIERGSGGAENLSVWHSLPDLLPKITTPAIASAIREWRAAQNRGD
jgi:orotate phosphoribosyltransferase